VRGSVSAIMPHARSLRLLIAERCLALRANTLWFGIAGSARKLDVTHRSVVTEMAGDWEIVHRADGG